MKFPMTGQNTNFVLMLKINTNDIQCIMYVMCNEKLKNDQSQHVLNTVKPAHGVTFIKQSPVLKHHT
jgi:hypothetical protein